MISPSATSKHRGLHTEVKDPSQSAVLISEALSLLEQKAIEIIPRPDDLTWMMMFLFFFPAYCLILKKSRQSLLHFTSEKLLVNFVFKMSS